MNDADADKIGRAVEEGINRALLDFETRLSALLASALAGQGRDGAGSSLADPAFTDYARSQFSPQQLAGVDRQVTRATDDAKLMQHLENIDTNVQALVDAMTQEGP
jgi:hypothetical protein